MGTTTHLKMKFEAVVDKRISNGKFTREDIKREVEKVKRKLKGQNYRAQIRVYYIDLIADHRSGKALNLDNDKI